MSAQVVLDLHYTEPELVALYDLQNPRGEDYDFYLELASARGAHKVLDLGCGTGQLVLEFASRGFDVTGVDPAEAMLNYAKKQNGASAVKWLQGDATAAPDNEFDFTVMTGNVAQVFLTDSQWQQTLSEISRALRAGGCIAFESRNPPAQAWQDWVPSKTRRRYQSPHGPVESWLELLAVENDIVKFAQHCRLLASGRDYIVKSELRFRSQHEIIHSLQQAGFSVQHIYGDWQSRPLDDESRLMVFVAAKLQSI